MIISRIILRTGKIMEKKKKMALVSFRVGRHQPRIKRIRAIASRAGTIP